MLKRKENGRLSFSSLDFEIFIGDLYQECKTEQEISWIKEQMLSIVDGLADERFDELE